MEVALLLLCRGPRKASQAKVTLKPNLGETWTAPGKWWRKEKNRQPYSAPPARIPPFLSASASGLHSGRSCSRKWAPSYCCFNSKGSKVQAWDLSWGPRELRNAVTFEQDLTFKRKLSRIEIIVSGAGCLTGWLRHSSGRPHSISI